MSDFINQRLNGIKAYIPGEQPALGEFIKLNTNEFPYPPAIGVENAAMDAVMNMNLYSDLACKSLKSSFEKVFGYGGSNVIFTNGSDEALYLCFLTFCGKDRGAAFADITYGFYSVYADLCGIEKKIIPLDDDLSIVPADYYSLERTIFIANPNAPTGKKLSVKEVESILANNPNNIVVIDEAYADFSGDSCATLLDNYKNLIIVGTFSKSRGMAGARLGYIITNEEIVSDIEKVKYSINPYNVNSITQALGVAVLDSNEYYASCVEEICNTRDDFTAELRKLKFHVIDSFTNFVFAKHDKISGAELADELRNKGVLVRHFNNDRIKDYVRISIGTPAQMETVINEITDIIGGEL